MEQQRGLRETNASGMISAVFPFGIDKTSGRWTSGCEKDTIPRTASRTKTIRPI